VNAVSALWVLQYKSMERKLIPNNPLATLVE